MVRVTGINSVTSVDPGTVNCAIMRMEFGACTRITHAKVLNMDDLCKDYEASAPLVHLNGGGTTERRLFAYERFVMAELKPGGCFHSDMLLVEDQSFDRNMARVEAVTLALFNSHRPMVRLNEHCEFAPGHAITGRSVKAAYRPFFPKLDGTVMSEAEAARESRTDNNTAHGVGQAHGSNDGKQRALNKKNAVKYGALICTQKRMLEIVPNLTSRDRERLSKGQQHDLYDCLFFCTYFASSVLFYVYKLRRDKADAKQLGALDKAPQRPRNRWQEIVEICHDLGTPLVNVETLLDVLQGQLLLAALEPVVPIEKK